MNLSRRNLGKSAVALSGAAALAACGILTVANGTVTVNLANAQAQATTVYTALAAEIPLFTSALPASVTTNITAVLTEAKNAVSIFAALPANSSYSANAKSVLSLLQTALTLGAPVLGGPTVLAIQAGLALISGLISGLSSVPAPPAVASTGYEAKLSIPGPIPVPLT